ncbi:MAG: hypothetical protein ACK57V_15265, partial [Pirellula sp.]
MFPSLLAFLHGLASRIVGPPFAHGRVLFACSPRYAEHVWTRQWRNVGAPVACQETCRITGKTCRNRLDVPRNTW